MCRRKADVCPCWVKILRLNSVSFSSDCRGLRGVEDGASWMEGQEWSARSMSLWHHYFQRPMSLSSKDWNQNRVLTAKLFIRIQLQPLPLFIVPQRCQTTINRTLGKLGAIVHTFYHHRNQWGRVKKKVPWVNIGDFTNTPPPTQMKSAPGQRTQGGRLEGV